MPIKRPTVKTKSVTAGSTKITKTTTNKPGLGGKTRSVTTERPGYSSTKTGMGPVKQARTYRREIKKDEKLKEKALMDGFRKNAAAFREKERAKGPSITDTLKSNASNARNTSKWDSKKVKK